MKELLLQMIFFLFVLNNKFLLLSVSTRRYVAYRQYTFWTTTSESDSYKGSEYAH